MQKDSKNFNLNSQSLLTLKAELSKKKQEIQKVNLTQKFIRPKKSEKASLWSGKNKGVEKRSMVDKLTAEEINKVRVAEKVMAKKVKLYEKMSRNLLTEEEAKKMPYLVDFDKKYIDKMTKKKKDSLKSEQDLKIDDDDDDDEEDDGGDDNDYQTADSSEEWVTFTDTLGRTRRCMQKDLDHYRSIDALHHHKKEPELLSEDMRRERERLRWEEEERVKKERVYYADVQQNEIRDHGVGYYGFSRDEEVRGEQMRVLQELRKQTKEQRKKHKLMMKKTREMVEERLRRVGRRAFVRKVALLSDGGLEAIIKKSFAMTKHIHNKDIDNLKDLDLQDGEEEEKDDGDDYDAAKLSKNKNKNKLKNKNKNNSLGDNKNDDDDEDDNDDDDEDSGRERELLKRDDSLRMGGPVREWDKEKEPILHVEESWRNKRKQERDPEFAPLYKEDYTKNTTANTQGNTAADIQANTAAKQPYHSLSAKLFEVRNQLARDKGMMRGEGGLEGLFKKIGDGGSSGAGFGEVDGGRNGGDKVVKGSIGDMILEGSSSGVSRFEKKENYGGDDISNIIKNNFINNNNENNNNNSALTKSIENLISENLRNIRNSNDNNNINNNNLFSNFTNFHTTNNLNYNDCNNFYNANNNIMSDGGYTIGGSTTFPPFPPLTLPPTTQTGDNYAYYYSMFYQHFLQQPPQLQQPPSQQQHEKMDTQPNSQLQASQQLQHQYHEPVGKLQQQLQQFEQQASSTQQLQPPSFPPPNISPPFSPTLNPSSIHQSLPLDILPSLPLPLSMAQSLPYPSQKNYIHFKNSESSDNNNIGKNYKDKNNDNFDKPIHIPFLPHFVQNLPPKNNN